MSNKTVNVRTRDNKVHGELSLDALKEKFDKLTVDRILKSEEMEPESCWGYGKQKIKKSGQS